ncbi:MAG: ClbS/DfsB family four-helix bundle protein [Cyclobacteriaceae bacterium]
MSKPTTKSELLFFSDDNLQKLFSHVFALSDEQRIEEFPPEFLNRNIRDVLAHLHHWHQLMMDWYEKGMRGVKPAMPAEGHTWKITIDLNREVQKIYEHVPLAEVVTKLKVTHEKVMKLIANHTDEELFEKEHYPWTGSSSLGTYFISATSSHYDWALKLIKKCRKHLVTV